MSRRFRTITIVGILCILFAVSLISIPSTKAAATLSLYTSGVTEHSITLSWNESPDTFFSGYQLYESTTGTNGAFTEIWSSSSKSQTSTYVYDLSPDTNYWFYVKDLDLLTGTADSNTYEATTTNVPTLSVTSTTSTTASLQWTDYNTYSSLVPFDSYTLQMSTIGAYSGYSTLTTITSSSQTTYVITGLSAGTYWVQIFDTVGSSDTALSDPVSFTLTAPTATPEFPSMAILAVFLVLSVLLVATLAIRKRKATKN